MKKVTFLFVVLNCLLPLVSEATASKMQVPQSFQGNWLKTDGSNEWVYGIYDSLVVCDNDFWKITQVGSSEKSITFQLEKEEKHKTLFGKLDKKGRLRMGETPKMEMLLSQSKTFRKQYIIPNDEDFSLPIFKKDTSIIKGFIKSFDAKYGNTGMVIVDNILANEQFSYPFTIHPDGTYQVKFPMYYPLTVYLDLPGIRSNLFMEPGKSLILFSDSTENKRFYKNSLDYAKREKGTLFLGDLSRVNTDLQSVDTINHFDYDKVMKNILDISAEDYKSYCLLAKQQDLDELQYYRKKHPFCKKALSIFQRGIAFRSSENILSFNTYRDEQFNSRKQEQGNQSVKPYVKEQLPSEYFRFLPEEDLNSPLSLLSENYGTVLNRMFFFDSVRSVPFNFILVAFSDYIRKNNIGITASDQDLLDKLLAIDTEEKWLSAMKKDSSAVTEFYQKNTPVLNKVCCNSIVYSEAQAKKIQKYFGINPGLVSEILKSQHLYSELKGGNQPFTENSKEWIRENLKEPAIIDFLMQQSQLIANENARILEVNKTKTGSHFNENPQVEADKVFDEIIQKYKGKVIFVDFWATWCGPCKEGIKKMKPVKEEYLGKDIVFVYLTDESSPINTYNMLLPDIKGEHYRLNSEAWSDVLQRFKITGIPHYVLINKDGKVVNNKIPFNFKEEDFRKMIQEYISVQ